MIALSTTSKFLFLFKTQKVVFGEGGGEASKFLHQMALIIFVIFIFFCKNNI